jgi:hypothetical protein
VCGCCMSGGFSCVLMLMTCSGRRSYGCECSVSDVEGIDRRGCCSCCDSSSVRRCRSFFEEVNVDPYWVSSSEEAG